MASEHQLRIKHVHEVSAFIIGCFFRPNSYSHLCFEILPKYNERRRSKFHHIVCFLQPYYQGKLQFVCVGGGGVGGETQKHV